MQFDEKIFVAGHCGLVGSAVLRQLQRRGYSNICVATRSEVDLAIHEHAQHFFHQQKPKYVFMCAAKVGGIMANNNHPADFIRDNIAIQQNMITAAHEHAVDRLLFLGSSCIYPKLASQPIAESALLTGPLEITNRPYAIAKIAGIEMCAAYNRQYHSQFLAAMPTNLYGPNDNYDLTHSHVLPALIRKCHDAKINNKDRVTLWGTGMPRREFLYSEDLADACIFLMNLPSTVFHTLLADHHAFPTINIGYGSDISIKELASLIKDIVGFDGKIAWDSSKPDGTPRKLLNSEKLRQLGWAPTTTLSQGIEKSYQDLLRQYQEVNCHSTR